MGNTHDSEIARIEADLIQTRWKTTEDYRWGYEGDRGPDTWWVHYPTASGSHQSPIDIITEECWPADAENSNITRLMMDYSGSYSRATSRHGNLCSTTTEDSQSESGSEAMGEFKILLNNGNTSRINFVNSRSYVTGGPYPNDTFVLEQIHVHWGESNKLGSEHLINGEGQSAEVHLVHWNEDLYASYEDAAQREDGILILATFVQLSDTRTNDALTLWSGLLEDTEYREENIPLPKEFPIRALLPGDTSSYWTYQGSFSTPPCYETVTWIVFEHPIYTTSKVLDKFRTLKYYAENEARPGDEYDGQIRSNNRPVQPMGIRKICYVDYAYFFSIHGEEEGGGGERPFPGDGGGEKADHFPETVQAHLSESRTCVRRYC